MYQEMTLNAVQRREKKKKKREKLIKLQEYLRMAAIIILKGENFSFLVCFHGVLVVKRVFAVAGPTSHLSRRQETMGSFLIRLDMNSILSIML